MKSIVSSLILLTGLAAAGEALGQGGVRGGADSVSVRAAIEENEAAAGSGDVVSIAVSFQHARGFHSWPNQPVVPPEFAGVNPIATTIEVVSLPEGAELAGIDWPEPVPLIVRYTGRPVKLLSYTDTAVAHVRLRFPADAPAGELVVELRVRYQSCDERVCYPPRTKVLSVPIPVGAGRSSR